MTQSHVLVVDDDPQILEIIARVLSSADLRVSTARRVSLARDILARQAIDLVLTDARMPGETGLELAASTRCLGIATIVMSGNPEWAAEHGLQAAEYLRKPFSIQLLLAQVMAGLGREAGASEDAADATLIADGVAASPR
jgi:DNA-binding response OmpR family regulator